jgi:hypothetical protein
MIQFICKCYIPKRMIKIFIIINLLEILNIYFYDSPFRNEMFVMFITLFQQQHPHTAGKSARFHLIDIHTAG